MTPQILVACIGNIFLGDDGFGPEVARRLASRPLPDDVRVIDFGIRGLDLVYSLLDGYDATIFVDAAPRGGEPGTLYTIQPDPDELAGADPHEAAIEPHGMNPMKVLSVAKSMGAEFKQILVVGCEPATFGPEEGQMGLSDVVAASVDHAVGIVESLIQDFRRGQCQRTSA